MNDLINKADNAINHLVKKLANSASYIRDKAQKEKYIGEVNENVGILNRLMAEVEREMQEEKEAKDHGDGGQVPPPPIPKTTGTISIRELAFWKDKETARAESLRRARTKWNF